VYVPHGQRLQGLGVVVYFPVAVSAPAFIEKSRSIEDHRSVCKPDHYAVTKTVGFEYADGIVEDRHIWSS
jgi:hypothetical protein